MWYAQDMPPLQLGIVGCGDIAGYTAWLARLNRGLRLAACCDAHLERAQAFARRHHISSVYPEYHALLSHPGLGAVYLAVPHHLHAEMVSAAIRSGLAVLVEKPLTRTLAEGEAVTAEAAAGGVKIGVNYQYRYDAGCFALARAVQRGELGAVLYARAHLPWRRERGYFENAAWHARLATAGGGTLLTQGSHLLDVALWAIGEHPSWAQGVTARRRFPEVEVEDLALGEVGLEGGAVVQIASTLSAPSEQAVSIEVYGEHGSARYSNRPYPHVRFRGVRTDREKPPAPGLHALQRSLEGFRAWIVDGKPYLTPAAEALPVLGAVEALYRSAGSGCREPVRSIYQPGAA